MKRRNVLRVVGVGLLYAAFGGLSHAEASPPDTPNVVLIVSDDQGYNDYGFMGHDVIKTPHLDKLASEGVVFTRGYVTTALCSPSLASMLTGLYPHQHGITGNDPVRSGNREPWFDRFESCPRLPALLKEAGYDSFQSGKLWLGHYSRAGFTDGMTVEGRHGEAGLAIGRETMKPVFDFIDRSKAADKPFFLWYAPFLPHTPHNPPERILRKYKNAGEQAKYYAMCEWLDETCGQLLGHLDEQDLTDNTVIVYICDNGWGKQAKGSPYEMGIRTPIMVKWPGRVRPRRDEEHLASGIDIVPTILAACGVKAPGELPGINLLDDAAVSGRTTIFAENFGHDMIDVNRPEASLSSRTCIQDQWKLIVWEDPQPEVQPFGSSKFGKRWDRLEQGYFGLYNLLKDPREKNNLADRHPERVAEMLDELNDWWNPSIKETQAGQ